jgi:hypothetical protein
MNDATADWLRTEIGAWGAMTRRRESGRWPCEVQLRQLKGTPTPAASPGTTCEAIDRRTETTEFGAATRRADGGAAEVQLVR